MLRMLRMSVPTARRPHTVFAATLEQQDQDQRLGQSEHIQGQGLSLGGNDIGQFCRRSNTEALLDSGPQHFKARAKELLTFLKSSF